MIPEKAAASKDVRGIAANAARDLALGLRLVALRIENFEPGQGKETVREMADQLAGAARRAVELYYLESLTQAVAIADGPLILRRKSEGYLSGSGAYDISRFKTQIPGCYNQLGFTLLLECELERARRRKAPLSVVLVKLDSVEPTVLAELARQSRDCCRLLDVVGTFGDRAIAMLLPDTDCDGARIAAQRVMTSFRSAREVAGRPRLEGVTVAVACQPEGGGDARELLARVEERVNASEPAELAVVG